MTFCHFGSVLYNRNPKAMMPMVIHTSGLNPCQKAIWTWKSGPAKLGWMPATAGLMMDEDSKFGKIPKTMTNEARMIGDISIPTGASWGFFSKSCN
ncbi:Uncharacterised protein [Chlamydia trachomatis]|nr:Uncharacterised protein [Chlamydia trachomatis]